MAKTLKQPTWAETRETFIGKASANIAKDAAGTVALYLVDDAYAFTVDANVDTVQAFNLGPAVVSGQKLVVTKIGTHYFLLYHGSIGSGGTPIFGAYSSVGLDSDLSIYGSRTAIMGITITTAGAYMVSATVCMSNGSGAGGDGEITLTADNTYPYNLDYASARHDFYAANQEEISLDITPTLVSAEFNDVISIVGYCPNGAALGKNAEGAWMCFMSCVQVGN